MQEINICVFCSSSNFIEKAYCDMATDLGRLIAEHGYNLVHGGGKVGLMGIISNSVQQGGRKVTGVLPEQLNLEGIASETDDEIIITKDMADRKTEMRKRSQAFIALPGGFGTLEELVEVITLKQLGYLNYPIVIINTLNFYEPLIRLFEEMYHQKFADVSYRTLYYIASGPEDAIEYVKNYKYPEVKKKWLI
ncbi:MAG: TIGR00730 family Rossman fold protein [Bacteroidetes bacterium HGW-Bacteroidetes-21]|nr:MAG: TIGR00730 family Rossman fold protein [Bacteroidetes bacterium HGW-Bacteroidetes-21]